MKVLSIVETAFRGTLEEQDDAALWVNGALQKGDIEIDILLRNNAVNYVVTGQNPTGVRIGDQTVEKPRILDEDLGLLKSQGSQIRVVREDLAERGIALDRIVSDFELIGRDQLASLVLHYDQVWHW